MERKCLCCSRERNRLEKMMARSEGWWPVGSYEEREEEGILKQLWHNYRRVRTRVKRNIRKEKMELRKRTVRKIREQVGTSCKLFWTNLRGKRSSKG